MSNAKIDAVAEDFEAFFVSMITESMMSGIKTDGPFGGGQGEKVFRSILVQEYGKEAASQGNFGIADAVRQQLLKMQELQEK
jgi:flagellar protein FlgJ